MRKGSIYALTAVTVLAAAAGVPMTAHAAVSTYTMSGGNGKVIMIGGNNPGDLNHILGQMGGQMNWGDCGVTFPNDGNWGNGIPGLPGTDEPGNMLPDNTDPIPELPGTDSPGSTDQDALTDRVADLVNEERARAGLAPLTVSASVTEAAEVRAGEITSSFSHTRPDGSSFSSVLSSLGIHYMGAGENIAYGQNSPEQVMQEWMNSAGHRANILNGNYTSIGVGHVKDQAGIDYWTQLFIQ